MLSKTAAWAHAKHPAINQTTTATTPARRLPNTVAPRAGSNKANEHGSMEARIPSNKISVT
jgi:hypothetical protein